MPAKPPRRFSTASLAVACGLAFNVGTGLGYIAGAVPPRRPIPLWLELATTILLVTVGLAFGVYSFWRIRRLERAAARDDDPTPPGATRPR